MVYAIVYAIFFLSQTHSCNTAIFVPYSLPMGWKKAGFEDVCSVLPRGPSHGKNSYILKSSLVVWVVAFVDFVSSVNSAVEIMCFQSLPSALFALYESERV